MITSNDALGAISTREWIDRLNQMLGENKYALASFYSSLVTDGTPARYEEQYKNHCPYRFYHNGKVSSFDTEIEMLTYIWQYLRTKEKEEAESKRPYRTRFNQR